MITHVLLNLFKKLRKRDKIRGFPSFLSLFCNECNKFNNTGAHIIIIIGFLINVQVQGHHPHQWAPFQVTG